MGLFQLVSSFLPTGDQPTAIDQLVRGLADARRDQVLLGVTGSGKTFSIAKVIEISERPALVIAHNKTLAAQLYQEFRGFFPEAAVEYFVSYYDYYQPEAYVPQSDTYIEKESTVNEELDRMRMSATRSLLERRDVVIVASVSCIYGLGSPDAYHGMVLRVEVGKEHPREGMLRKLAEIQYERSAGDLEPGRFRVRGDVIEVWPSYETHAVRIELYGDEVEHITTVDPLRGVTLKQLDRVAIYPNSHYVTPREQLVAAIETIKTELAEQLEMLERGGKPLEAQRLHQRTMFDLEMIAEVGYCSGIENYSRHLTGRRPGEPPPTLLDYLAKDALVIVDESHQTLPQIRAMYNGDQSRKKTLVDFGFRLPSAMDNRPLRFEEFDERRGQTIYVSATPSPYELSLTGGEIAEQVIRPTGLLDPEISVRSIKHQVDDLLAAIRGRVAAGERVLVTTLTKRMAEELSGFYKEAGVKVEYLHSDVVTLDRVRILRELRKGFFDVLVGVNLLREGLDLPEVSLVAILDADKEGFLRSERSLIQTIGRAARNVNGQVIMYADTVTDSMARAIAETDRRRGRQSEYNRLHGITPETIVKSIEEVLGSVWERDYVRIPDTAAEPEAVYGSPEELDKEVKTLEKAMRKAAEKLDFEEAAALRDRIKYLRRQQILA